MNSGFRHLSITVRFNAQLGPTSRSTVFVPLHVLARPFHPLIERFRLIHVPAAPFSRSTWAEHPERCAKKRGDTPARSRRVVCGQKSFRKFKRPRRVPCALIESGTNNEHSKRMWIIEQDAFSKPASIGEIILFPTFYGCHEIGHSTPWVSIRQ